MNSLPCVDLTLDWFSTLLRLVCVCVVTSATRIRTVKRVHRGKADDLFKATINHDIYHHCNPIIMVIVQKYNSSIDSNKDTFSKGLI